MSLGERDRAGRPAPASGRADTRAPASGAAVPAAAAAPAAAPVADALLQADFVVSRRAFNVVARLSLAPGQRLSLFGASGAGKTTILEAIAGIVTLESGEVRLAGRVVNAAPASWRHRRGGGDGNGPPRQLRPVEMRRRSIAVVRQPTTLFPHLSLRKNVAYGLKDDRRVSDVLALVGLEDLARAMPGMLSGGQRQRVCLARAMARPFQALLLDEPFSAIDVSSRAALRDLAIDVTGQQNAVALLVTHDLTEAQAFGHQIAVIDEGRLLQVAESGQLVRNPATTRVAELCGYTTFLDHGDGRQWALHPDRFVDGREPERGIVVGGTVTSVQAFGSRFACGLLGGPAAATRIDVHVDSPPEVGKYWEVTALDPPLVSMVTDAEEQEG